MFNGKIRFICRKCGKEYSLSEKDMVNIDKIKNKENIYCKKCRVIMKLIGERK